MMLRKSHDQNALKEIIEELKCPSRLSELPRRVELCQKALAIAPRETQADLKRWATLQDDLASSLAQTPMGPRAQNIEQAIRHFEQALEVRTRQAYPKEWASTMNNLATAYRDRVCGERADNVEKAIAYYWQALEVRTREALLKEWAMTQFNLAGAYYKRVREERAKNLECAIWHSHQALKVYRRDDSPHYWAQVKNTLGEIYRVRISGSRIKNIERAIYHLNQALEVHTRLGAFPEDWGMVQNNLGNAYLARTRGEQAENLERAIYHYEQALEVRTRKALPKEWAATQYNLGNAYRNRIRGDQTENIEQSIHYFMQALEIRTRQDFPEDWAETQNNLGNAYMARIRDERAENIEQSIYHYEQALEVRTREAFPADWAETQNNLGNAYLVRTRGKRAENLDRAIRYYRQALEVRTRQAFPADWAQTLNNLAGAERTYAAENIEQSIQHLQQSLEVYTREAFPHDWAGTQNNLAIAYTSRIQGERAENIENAIRYYRQALEVYTRASFPDNCLKTARALGNLAFEQQSWELAREAYGKAFGAQDVLIQNSLSRASKQAELGEAQNLLPRAAYAHVQLHEEKRAVEVLEHGRAQLLRESLERQWLEQLPTLGFKSLYEDYMQAMQQYNALQSIVTSENARPSDWTSRMDQALERMQAAAGAIREKAGQSHPQYRFFLQALSFGEIQEQAREKPLVYLCVTSASGLALIVTGEAVQAIELPKLNQTSLQKQIWSPSDEEIDRINTHIKEGKIEPEDIQAVSGGYFSTYALWSLTPFLARISQELKQQLLNAWQKTLDDTTQWLWEAAMGDLVSVLKEHSQSVMLIPAGQLAFLPLHAAWTTDTTMPRGRRYALDELNVSYAPSAHALWQANLAARRPANRLMAVDNPDNTLLAAKDEVPAALEAFKQTTHLPGKKATLKVVKEEMQKAHVLHFSTHGRAGWEKAEQAQLKLADGDLTLPDIFELDLNQARLAVLSACETGMPGLELIDEMIGLPAGMMQAGVPGVIGSLWSVNDQSTAMLMARFYKFWRSEGKIPQEALRLAQQWLRDRLFDSPYYWAAFTYTGV